MPNLVLDSLEIKNFRAFKHLRIEKLGRVNLIVGKNNVGKSSVLEALMLYAHRGHPFFIWEILKARNESRRSENRRLRTNPAYTEERSVAVKYLFHGRPDINEYPQPITIGPIDEKDETLSVAIRWYNLKENAEGVDELTVLKPETLSRAENPVPRLFIKIGSATGLRYRLDLNSYGTDSSSRSKYKEIHCVFASASGLNAEDINIFWDGAILANMQEDVVSALRLIAPHVESVNLVGSLERNPLERSGLERGDRFAVVRNEGLDNAIPLSSSGEGMNRMFGIALALVNAKDGILLIDEVDTGIHYSVLSDLWKLIFKVAHRLNVQVFATTHSKDCIEAFQQAADENTEEEGMLVRLENRKAGVGAVTFDEQELAVVTREQIEVR